MSAPRQTTAQAGDQPWADIDLARAASLLTDAACRAGAVIMEHFHTAPSVAIKGDMSPVTRADHDSEAIILAALARLAPEIPVVSEESCGAVIGPLPARLFLVDPLDGTKEFIKKLRDFTVNIALIDNGRPCFGLVYAPARALLAERRPPSVRFIHVKGHERDDSALGRWNDVADRLCALGVTVDETVPAAAFDPSRGRRKLSGLLAGGPFPNRRSSKT